MGFFCEHIVDDRLCGVRDFHVAYCQDCSEEYWGCKSHPRCDDCDPWMGDSCEFVVGDEPCDEPAVHQECGGCDEPYYGCADHPRCDDCTRAFTLGAVPVPEKVDLGKVVPESARKGKQVEVALDEDVEDEILEEDDKDEEKKEEKNDEVLSSFDFTVLDTVTRNDGRGSVTNVHTPPPQRLGVITWNLNHFGVPTELIGKKKGKGAKTLPVPVLTDDALTSRVQLARKAAAEWIASVEEDKRKGIEERTEAKLERVRQLGRICGWKCPEKEKTKGGKKYVKPVSSFKSHIRYLCGELKRRAMVHCILTLFEKNPWLDALLLHEVNNYRIFDAYMKAYGDGAGLKWASGPEMHSSGGGPRKQIEFYPIVVRGTFKIASVEWINADGSTKKGRKVTWNKKDNDAPTYRPVVVYSVEDESRRIKAKLGIVHTTPGETEFYRPFAYSQIREPLAKIADEAADDEWSIVGGDFYLGPEAVVLELSEIPDDVLRERVKDTMDVEKLEQEHEGTPLDELLGDKRIVGSKNEKSVKNTQIVPVTGRDYLRNVLKTTFESNLPQGMQLACSASGSNWHDTQLLADERLASILQYSDDKEERIEAAKFFATARVADFFVFRTVPAIEVVAGLADPRGGILLIDTEDSLLCSSFWAVMSDHFPVAARFSDTPADDELLACVNIDKENAEHVARFANRLRLANRLWRLELVSEGKVVPKLTGGHEGKTKWCKAAIGIAESFRSKTLNHEQTRDNMEWPHRKWFLEDEQPWSSLPLALRSIETELRKTWDEKTARRAGRFDYTLHFYRPQDVAWEEVGDTDTLLFIGAVGGSRKRKNEESHKTPKKKQRR